MSPPSLRLAFITDGEPFHGGSPEERALGGSETALVQVARALARRGHRVQVFCRCPAPGEYRGVIYRDSKDLVAACPEERWEVVVVSRFMAALGLPLQAGLRVLWNHDLLVNPAPLAQRLDEVDLCLVLSRFHAGDFTRALPAVAPKLGLTRNGLDLDLLARAGRGVTREPGLVTYVSRPERGLKLLLEKIWPRLRQAMPHLTLAICGYQVAEMPAAPAWRREYAEIQELLRLTPGLRLLGSLAKEEYYRHLASCECLLYPCTFPEISCLAVLEAQALATPLLTSDAYALGESVVMPQFRVAGRPGAPEYVEAYLKQALDMLGDPARARTWAAQAQAQVRALHDWDVIAREWEGMFLARLQEKISGDAKALAAGLLLGGDRALAGRLLGRPLPVPPEGPPPPDPREAELLAAMAELAGPGLAAQGCAPLLGVLSCDGGRTAQALAGLLPQARVMELSDGAVLDKHLDLLVIRDRLEREPDPAAWLAQALPLCAPGASVLLCLASGAWPLRAPGHLGRAHDLGREEAAALLPGRPLRARHLPQGLVHAPGNAYHLGRWLVLAPAQGPPLGRLDPGAALRRARPAPAQLLDQVSHAGLL